jgi:molybdopterin/thiamine biosynthesis adenylyltransferase
MDDRYARQVELPEVGEQGQWALHRSRVLVVGLGGLGSPVALYLAGAGVGTIGLCDSDHVTLSNLNRQIVHQDASVGLSKVESARRAILKLNPAVGTPGYAAFDEDFAHGFDVLVDCTDNIDVRYAMNKASIKYDLPFVHGALGRYIGQVSTFIPGCGCYRCWHPVEPPRREPKNKGVLGPLCGVIGTLQAAEVLKVILSLGDLLLGRVLTYDMLTAKFVTLTFEQNPECSACGSPSPAK